MATVPDLQMPRRRVLPASDWWRLFLLLGSALMVAVVVSTLLGADAVARTGVTVGTIGAALALLLGPRTHRAPAGLPWQLLAAAVLATGLAGMWTSAEDTWLWTALRMLSAALLVAALLVLNRASRVRLASWIEGLTVGTALALVLLEVAILPFLASQPAGLGLEIAAPALLVPAALVCVVALLTSPGAWVRAGRFLLIGVIIKAIAAGAALVIQAQDLSPMWLPSFWLAAALCWGIAALHPTATSLTQPVPDADTAFSRPRFALVAVAALVAPAMVAADQTLPGESNSLIVVAGAVVLYSLLLARLAVAIRQVESANRVRDELQAQLAHDAAHDSLTQLPNRSRGLALVRRALATDRGTDSTTALLFVDLDGFKNVNDTLGHKAGDAVLRSVANRLSGSVREGDTVIRFGGDEFLVLLPDIQDVDSAMNAANRLVRAAAFPIELGDEVVRVGASIGVALASRGSGRATDLIHEADVAAYVAKSSGRGRAELYDDSMRDAHLDRQSLEDELRKALQDHELTLVYQPIVDTFTGIVEGFEALVRWQNPRRGLLFPGQFLPVAEQSDLVCDIDAWVLETAARQVAAWTASGDQDVYVAINLAPRHIARSRIVNDVQRAMTASGIRPRLLSLEVGERVLDDPTRSIPNLTKLRRMGARVVVDDYGKGFSSLGRLADLPVDALKVHRDHVDLDSDRARDLLRLMIEGAHTVGLKAVAQGVELDSQLQFLRSLDCDAVQGFHIAEPMPAERATEYLRNRNRDGFAGLLA